MTQNSEAKNCYKKLNPKNDTKNPDLKMIQKILNRKCHKKLQLKIDTKLYQKIKLKSI